MFTVTLTVPLSTQVYRRVPANLMLELTCDALASHPGGSKNKKSLYQQNHVAWHNRLSLFKTVIFLFSLICRANIFSFRFKTLHAWNCCKNHNTETNANSIWYNFILNLEIRAWNLYFLNENVLHLNNKNKPCLLTRIIDFLSPKVSAVGIAVHFFGVSCLLSELVHMYMYTFETERGNKLVREKSDIKFLFWKDWD